MTDVAMVLPLYDNASTLSELLRRCRSAVPHAVVVLVDDGCTAGSGEAAVAAARADAGVTVLRHAQNEGQQHAIRTGLAATDAAVRVVLDADLQDPPEAIPDLLAELHRSDVEAVFAGRRGDYEGRLRRLSGMAHRSLLTLALGLPIDAGGFVAMTARCADAVLAMDGPPQLVAMIGRTGLATTSVPVARARRPVGNSTIDDLGRARHAVHALPHVGRAWLKRIDPRTRTDDGS